MFDDNVENNYNYYVRNTDPDISVRKKRSSNMSHSMISDRKSKIETNSEYPSFAERVYARKMRNESLNKSNSIDSKSMIEDTQSRRINNTRLRKLNKHNYSVDYPKAHKMDLKKTREEISDSPAPNQYEVKGYFEKLADEVYQKKKAQYHSEGPSNR